MGISYLEQGEGHVMRARMWIAMLSIAVVLTAHSSVSAQGTGGTSTASSSNGISIGSGNPLSILGKLTAQPVKIASGSATPQQPTVFPSIALSSYIGSSKGFANYFPTVPQITNQMGFSSTSTIGLDSNGKAGAAYLQQFGFQRMSFR
jgi:hypothetical protein